MGKNKETIRKRINILLGVSCFLVLCLVGLTLWLFVAGTKPTQESKMETELGVATEQANQTQNQMWQKATPFNMIDAKTMEVVSYPAVSEGKDATIFLFW